MKNIVKGAVMLAASVMLLQNSANALNVGVDQIIYQNGSGVDSSLISGTVDVTVSGANQLTILLRNTSADGAFTDPSSPALMLLTGVGLQLPGVNIISGSVLVNGGSTAVNFDVGQSTTDISNQWGYNNAANGGFLMSDVLPTDSVMSSVNNGQQTRFAGAPPVNIGGPNYGALSANETQFGASQAAVEDTIRIILNLDGAAPSVATIDSGNVVLAFGSPNAVPDGGSTLVLLGSALTGLGLLAGRRKMMGNA